MKNKRPFRWPHLIVLLATLACAGSWAAGQVRRMRDRSEVAQMTSKKRTECVGRFLVDVPIQAQASLLPGRVAGFEIETIEESEMEFRKRVAAREAEIEAVGAKSDGGGPGGMVDAHDLRVPGMTGRALVFGRTRSYGIKAGRRVDDEWVTVEAYAHIGGVSFSLSREFLDETQANLAEALLMRLQARNENEIPRVPGFCIRGAIFADPLPAYKTEQAVMHFGFPGHPDIQLTFANMPGHGTGRGLLARTADLDAKAGVLELLQVSRLRAGKRSINGLAGEEVVERVREYNFTTGYAFNWETQGLTDDVLRPYLSLDMQTGISGYPGGEPTDTSLHEDALLALWDSIASTIRPHAPGPRPAPSPRSAPPG